ncbi:DUF5682 family protein [Tsukamurella paurometabola]|uniref:Uncharacterized protein n=1 Tax=Tsukamurella paurometabola TaxID=2061 RepID=A0A3P8MEV0_TSUPA|nr:DUF5682 family protein [Tsukamurella paurometabola]MBS4099708.1 hypothetical protein [Tsukamurella paurometabola]UEA83714.1 DUF5682 family protein [Tsukamurella paurometabola]VDR40853.1 Uncharacterised protein [Tsukamurella paurometabola]
MTAVHVLGVRHHGPGSARAVVAELERLRPEVVLIEGPADATDLLQHIADPGLQPPVALLGYAADDPSTSAFWPFAVFSPEWQAASWAVARGVPAEFIDLPVAQTLADRGENDDQDSDDPVRADPIAALAAAAGYDDAERWWDDVIESRGESDVFGSLGGAMRAVREAVAPAPPGNSSSPSREERREAHMRKCLRAAMKRDGVETVVVICGAWHVPALTGTLPSAAADAKVLAGAPKVKSRAAWVPWTHSRLSSASGYGAGVTSPGWYHHLFTTEPDEVVVRWLTGVAELLRSEDVAVSSAHIIEATRLAETLAALRRRPLAGLSEVEEATLAVLCDGSTERADLVRRRAVVGERLGTVPEDLPVVPLQADIDRTARSLRFKPSPAVKQIVLDLRKPGDVERSRLLHRLRLLGVEWGEPAETSGKGTFKEGWAVQWRPELSVDVVVASVWGTTVPVAATRRLAATAEEATSLAEVTSALEAALLADLPDAVSVLLHAIENRAAVAHDVDALMAALPALGRTQRYGDTRGTDTGALADVAAGLLLRVCIGLPAAVTGLGEDAAVRLVQRVDAVEDTVGLLTEGDRERWYGALRVVADRPDVHGSLVGRVTRLLLDAGLLDGADAAVRLHRALSSGVPPDAKAAWIAGFLGRSGIVLVHDPAVLGVLDEWLVGLGEQEFIDVLPLLRRTFAEFDPGVRRNIGDRIGRIEGGRTDAETRSFDAELTGAALATAARLLGIAEGAT